MNIFHRHKFDPDKWKLVSETHTARTVYLKGVITGSLPNGVERVWSNTCKDCGDLVFRRVQEIE